MSRMNCAQICSKTLQRSKTYARWAGKRLRIPITRSSCARWSEMRTGCIHQIRKQTMRPNARAWLKVIYSSTSFYQARLREHLKEQACCRRVRCLRSKTLSCIRQLYVKEVSWTCRERWTHLLLPQTVKLAIELVKNRSHHCQHKNNRPGSQCCSHQSLRQSRWRQAVGILSK